MTKQVILTHGQVAIVDDADFTRLSAFKWYAIRANMRKENWYAKRNCWENGKTRTVLMHRELMGEHHVAIDHIDGDGLNNTRANLRSCSHTLNNANTERTLASSGYRGVYWEPNKEKYAARISLGGRRLKRLGSFDSPIEAAKVRDDFVAELYGEFAVLNFPKNRVGT